VDFETGLNTAMRRLRSALREDADAPRYIETLPRRGYRFIGTMAGDAPRNASPESADHELQTQLMGSEAAAQRTDCLVIVHSPQQAEVGRRHLLGKDVTTIGRGLENDIVLASHSISRRHTRIEFRNGKVFVVDAASTNGTFINDDSKPVRDGPLQPGDVLRIGDRSFAYLHGADIEAQQHDLMARIAMTDGASGAASRKHLDALLTEEIQRAQRHGRPLSLLMIGIEHARDRSDHGELIGDATLRTFATTLHKRLRPQDRLGRYGDREFCVLMPETTLAGALKIADELPALIAGGTASGTPPLTVVAGAATLAGSMQLVDLYRAAELSLERSRRA
jgi:diguanylate cyclase (GGDEF)-like protein